MPLSSSRKPPMAPGGMLPVGRKSPLSIDVCAAEACNSDTDAVGSAMVFQMDTPPSQKVKSHFIGTPTAEGILNAFLAFDAVDVDDGPPLDFDECCAGLQGDNASPDDGSLPQLLGAGATSSAKCSPRSLGSESTRSSEGRESTPLDVRFGDADAESENDEEEEHYEDDFEEESDGEEEDA